jgi:ATP-dependent Clp protease adaptor protein ClpS
LEVIVATKREDDGGLDVIERPPQIDKKTTTKTTTEKPKLYKVILLNDDYTPFDLVVNIINQVFKTGEEKAIQIMMAAHVHGKCVIAVYTKDIAETKSAEATALAESKGFPMLLVTEPEE